MSVDKNEKSAMPSGIMVFRWDDQNGPTLVKSFPDSLKITTNLMIKIYAGHQVGSNHVNFASLTLKNSKVISVINPEKGNIVVALLLRRDESIHSYRGLLRKLAQAITKDADVNFQGFLP